MSVDEFVRLPKFTGKNFQGWKRQVQVVLSSKGLLEALSLGYLETKPEDEMSAAKSKDEKAQAVLFTAMSPAIVEEIVSCETAAAIWERLLLIYENSSDVNVERLLHEFYVYMKPNSMSMAQHIAHIDSLALQLKQVNEPQSERAIMSKMLNSLPDTYSGIKTAWDSTHPDHKTKQALVNRLIKEEVKGRHDVTKGESKEMVMIARGQTQRKGLNKKKGSKCFNCGSLDHWARECPKPKRPRPRNDENQQKEASRDALIMTIVSSFNNESRWLMDSGASFHVCQRREKFDHYEDHNQQLKVGGGHVNAIGRGTVNLRCIVPSGTREITLRNVLHIPNMGINLFAQNRAQMAGFVIKGHGSRTLVCKGEEVVASGLINPKNAMTFLELEEDDTSAMVLRPNRTIEDWHQTLGHANIKVIEEMAKKNLVEGLKISHTSDNLCEVCPLGKGTRACHTHESSIEAKQVGDHIDMDLVTSNDETIGGKKYALICKDRYSGYSHVFLMKTRNENEAYEKLQEYLATFDCESGNRVKLIRTDNGSEFIGERIRVLCAIEHCLLDFAAPRCPEQNGAAERNNRTLVETARTVMSANPHLPYGLWGEALNTAVYVRNRIPKTGNDKSPFELYFGRKPRVDHIVPFGTEVHSLINDRRTAKFDPKTEAGYVVGFTNRSNTYRVFLPQYPKIKITCDVIFRKHGPAQRPSLAKKTKEEQVPVNVDKVNEETKVPEIQNTVNETMNSSQADEDSEIESPSFSIITNAQADDVARLNDVESRSAVDRYFDWFLSSIRNSGENVDHGMIAFSEDEPRTFSEAISGPNANEWKQAIKSELDAHSKNETWAICSRPKTGTTLSVKWIFKLKKDQHGNIMRYKARLVARGYEQKKGIDYTETFAPVARSESIRILLSIGAAKNMFVERFDVSTAFLYGKIEEEIYVEPPEGIKINQDKCLKLNKALYGLKQAPKVWNSTFNDVIKDIGFVSIASDPCIYIDQKNRRYLALYVDDGLVLGLDQKSCLSVIHELNKHFETKRVNGIEFLGIEINQTKTGVHLSQQKYIKEMLKQFKMEDCSEAITPLADFKMLFEKNNEPSFQGPYRSAIGSLLYAALCTRPDILYATILLSRFNENPKLIHWVAVKRIMRYLKKTQTVGLMFEKSRNEVEIKAYADADWGSDPKERKSTSGVLVTICDSPVIFVSKQQSTVAQSSSEAELIAANEATKEIAWLTTFLKELKIDHTKPKLFVDNMGAIHMTKNNEVRRKSKHIDLKYHYVRLKYLEGLFDIVYVNTADQKADFLTKPLCGPQLHKLMKLSNVIALPGNQHPEAKDNIQSYAAVTGLRRGAKDSNPAT